MSTSGPGARTPGSAPPSPTRVGASGSRPRRPPGAGPQRSVNLPVRRLRAAYDARPLVTAAAMFAVLATVRLSGAYLPTLLVLSFVITPAVIVAVPAHVRADAGLRALTSWRAVAYGCGAVVVAYAVTVGGCAILLGTGPDNWASGLLAIFSGLVPSGLPGAHLIVVLVAVACLGLLVPIAEEVCYRGLLLHAVSQRHSAATAVTVTSAAWAVVHLGDYGLAPWNPRMILGMIPSVFVMGLALGWCRVAADSVVASIAAQGLANLALAAWVLSW
jgi:CAAX protease family protein